MIAEIKRYRATEIQRYRGAEVFRYTETQAPFAFLQPQQEKLEPARRIMKYNNSVFVSLAILLTNFWFYHDFDIHNYTLYYNIISFCKPIYIKFSLNLYFTVRHVYKNLSHYR